MTLLLKTVWRTLLKSNSIGQNTIRSRGLSSSLTEASRSKSPDSVMMSIESAPTAAEVLAAVQAHLPSLTHKHMLQALRTLFQLHKSGRIQQEPEEIVRDPGFSALCQNFKKHARALEVGEAIEATKVLSYLRVPVDSLVVQTMLQIIRCNINFLNIRQVMFLDFILSRFDTKNHLVDALKLALPLTFQIHLPFELDKEDLPLLRDMLAYCCAHDLPDRCINNVVTGLLLHDQSIDAQVAKSLIWSLCQINCTEQRYPTRAQLLHICYDILTPKLNQLGYDDVLRTAARVKGRVLEKHPEYYHEQLMDAIANYVIDNDVGFEKGLLIARVLSRIAHTHLGLAEYLSTLAASEPSTLANARTNILFGFVNCLANNNYTPPAHTWEELRRQMSQNPLLQTKVYTLPWIKVCLELASLGHYEDKLLERIFSDDFLNEYLSREQNTLDYLQLLSLYEAVKAFHSDKYVLKEEVLARARELHPVHPATEQLQAAAARGLGGGEYVVRNVQLPSGVVADVLMCMKSGYPVKLSVDSDGSKVPYSSLEIPAGAVVVCVMNFSAGCFSMNSNRLRGTFRLILDTLEKQGYVAVPVNLHDWLHAPAHERVPYLMREINYKCGEIGMKLSAT